MLVESALELSNDCAGAYMAYYDSAYDSGSTKHEFKCSIPLYLILSILTAGLFNLYWNYKQMQACNYFLRRKEFSFLIWFFLTIFTCGLYHIYYQYKMGASLVEIQRSQGRPTSNDLPVLSAILSIIGLFVIADCFHQLEINKLCE